MHQDVTFISPLALALVLTAGLLTLVLPRRAAILPFLLAVVLIPQNQRIVVGSLDFFILRILIVFGWARILSRGEFDLRLNRIDKLVIAWVISGFVMYNILWQSADALINRLGTSFDVIGIYFLFRCLVRDFDDIVWVIKTFMIISIPVGMFMLIEHETGRNLFSIFGGVREFTGIRDGRLRCHGAFAHPITAGAFGASIFPLIYSLKWVKGQGKFLVYIGVAASILIVFSTASSGPALGLAAGGLGIFMWRFRAYMKQVRWAIVFGLIFLHIVMKGPVWALLMKVKVFGSSTGYHRYHLFDQFINHFGDWWLVGVKSTAYWGYYLFDVTNHFIRVAVDGGLLTLVFFILILSYGFGAVGRAIKTTDLDPGTARVIWALGASLLVHIVCFFGVSYWDQIKIVLYMDLAMVSVVRSILEKKSQAAAVAIESA